MTRTSFAFSIATALLIGPAPVIADEQGELLLSIGDETASFPLDASQSDWSGSESWASISITGKPTDEETWEHYKTFNLGLSIVNGAADNPEATLLRTRGESELQRLYAKADEDLTVTIDEMGVDGAFLAVSGSFDGPFGTSENYGRDIDLSEPVQISGTFVVTLGPVE